MGSENPKDIVGRTKPDLSLIPPVAMVHTAMAMVDGARKYGPYNWRAKKVSIRTYLAASMRHILDYLDGERDARDSGVHHLGHAIASLGIALDAESLGMVVDDRPTPGKAAELMERFTKTTEKPPVCQPAVPGATSQEPPFSKRRVYISGPMRGIKDHNFPAFDAARDRFQGWGWDVWSPADADRQNGCNEQTPDRFSAADIRVFAQRDVEALISMRAEDDDAIAMLPGWEKSKGACAERALARWLGLDSYDAVTGKVLPYE